jgi:soluble cytochrome b562
MGIIMSNKKQKELSNALKKMELSSEDAEILLRFINAQKTKANKQKDMEDFQRGLWLRNLLVLIVLAAIFFLLISQNTTPF